jgi:TRAP-type mannitol/chloroaromatic compound transport system permease small subunit
MRRDVASRGACAPALDARHRACNGNRQENHDVNRVALGFIEKMDQFSMLLGKLAAWLVAIACAISAFNAIVRYSFNIGSNAWLEAQWYLFAATVYFGAPMLLKLNEHVRVDVIYGGRSGRTKAWIDLLGLMFFYMPVCIAMALLSLNFVYDSFVQHEMSSSAGGLLRWPVKALIPLGFTLLALQGVSEIFKRIGYLTGTYNMDTHYERPLQ